MSRVAPGWGLSLADWLEKPRAGGIGTRGERAPLWSGDRRASNRKTQRLSPCSVAQNAAARSRRPHTAAGANRTALGVRGVLHSPDALHDRLESRREHGGGQLGYALAIADSGFDPFLD